MKEAKRRRIATVTIELQKRTLLSAEVYREVDLQANLHSALVHLPSNKAFETYANYEAMMLPIILEEGFQDVSVCNYDPMRLRRAVLIFSGQKPLAGMVSKWWAF